jgi:glycosyltransferase involved in cell wall biosynthesis
MTHLCLLGHAPSIHLQRWALAMVERGFRVSVLSAAAHTIPEVRVTVLPALGRLGWFGRIAAVRRAVGALSPDLVHAHYVTSYGLLGACAGRRPLVLTAWGSDLLVSPRDSLAVRWLTGWVLRRAALITADSRDVLQAIAGYRPRARTEEVFWGADLRRFHPGSDRERSGGFHVASVRGWEPNYRVEHIVRACASLAADGPVTLHLFGSGSGEPALRDLVARLGIARAVVWHGQVGTDELARQLRACHVSVSIPESDATSVSLLESMACALPVVVSDLPANRQWIDADGGLVVDGAEPAALARALRMLRDDPARRARLGAHNRARVADRGSSEGQMDRMARLYHELLAAGPRGA